VSGLVPVRLGRWTLPNTPELLLDWTTATGKPLWKYPRPVIDQPPKRTRAKPGSDKCFLFLPNGSSPVSEKLKWCGASVIALAYSASTSMLLCARATAFHYVL